MGRRCHHYRMAAETIDLDQFPSRIGPFEFKGIRDILGVAAVLAPLALALRALVVSHFDYSIAETLVTSTGSGTFLAVALVGIVPGFSYGAALAIAYVAGRERSRNRAVTIAVLIFLTVPQVFASTVVLATVEIISVPLVYLVGWYKWPPSQALRDLLAVALMLYLVGVALPLRMWVPAEQVTMSGDLQTVYVLDESGDHATLFLPERTAVVLVQASSLNDRQLCAVGDRRSVGERIFGTVEVGMPRCPSNSGHPIGW